MRRFAASMLAAGAFAAAGFGTAAARGDGAEPAAPSDCEARIGYGGNGPLGGYWVDDPALGRVCVPFTPTVQRPPSGYTADYYVDEFTDAKLAARWDACRRDEACAQRVRAQIAARVPHQFRATGTVTAEGRIDAHGDVVLADIRRPSFFARDPYRERIAATERRAYTVEFTVPRERYERAALYLTSPIRLRGWYLQGDGVDDGTGKRVHAVAVMIAGRSVETTAIEDPRDPLYTRDQAGSFVNVAYPNATTEKWGVRSWREYLRALHEGGFDVLTFDKRGHGISGGLNDGNNLEMAEDIYRALDQLETGVGLRILTPDRRELAGSRAAGLLLRGRRAREVPVVIGGPSQGSMIASWAMHKNVATSCAYDLPERPCSPPRGYNVKGGIILASFVSGPGFRNEEAGLVEAALRAEYGVVSSPSSEVLANISRWPAVFLGKGLWDYAESLEGTFDAYQRARGLKRIAVVRGPHSENEFGDENVAFMRKELVAFAQAAVVGRTAAAWPSPKTLRDLVAGSPASWEPSSRPVR